MDSNIYLNQSVRIDLPTLLDTRLLVQANSGGGKSWLLRRLLEQSHGKVQQIVIDLEGEFATLREQYDYVLAGKEGDTPADPRSAGLLAKKLLELNVSAIIDLYDLHYQERKHFVRLFLESMINAPKHLWHPCLVVIDEAHKFCPEKEPSEASSAVIDLATLGRKRGFCAILATQRLSKLHKDAAAECNNKLIGRTGLDVDRKRASEELGFTTKEQYLSLRSLAAGEFFAFGPAISPEVIKVTIGSVRTTHPKAGTRIFTTAPIPPTENIKRILGALKDLPHEAEQEVATIATLQEEIRQLKAERNRPHTASPSPETARQKQEITTLTKRNEQLEIYANVLLLQLKDIIGAIRTLQDFDIPQPPDDVEMLITATMPPPKASDAQEAVAPEHPQPGRQNKYPAAGINRILHVLASRYPMTFTKSQLATLARLSARGGAYIRYLSQLKSQGYITTDTNRIALTNEGLAATGTFSHTAEQPVEMWRGNLSGGARRIFDFLVASYPAGFTRDDIGDQVGLTARGGAFGRYLSLLRNNGLIDVEGNMIKASETLFLR
jgi:FtsZ-binding cell division protein ZapB